MPWGSRIHRAIIAFLILALAGLACPRPAQAAPVPAPARAITLTFDIVGVQAKESVTIRTRDFPIRTDFTIRMDKVGKQAVNGTVVKEFNSGSGGTIEMQLPIPEALRGELILAVRIESKDGYVAYNWFFNEFMVYKPPKGSAVKPELSFSGVKKNDSAVVQGKNFPPNVRFSVRVGPYYTFYRDYIFVDSVTSDASGNLNFTLPLTARPLQNTDYIMARVDGAGVYAYNNFQNVDGGAVVSDAKLYKFSWCQVLYANALPAMQPKEQFDAVWTVQNTSNTVWPAGRAAYHFVGGEAMHKYDDFYGFGRDIGKAEVFDVAVDMIAPETPGWHSTTWSIYKPREGTLMCTLKISVFVKGQ